MFTHRSRWLIVAAAVALLAACGKHDAPASSADATTSTTPAKTVLVTVSLIKQGRLDDLLRHLLPPDEYQHMRAEWTAKHDKLKQIDDEDRRNFNQGMAKLTAPDANQQLWAQIEPKLAQLDKQTKARLPMMIGFGQIALDTQISKAEQLSADQKAQATDVVDAVGAWAQKTDWTDPDRIKQVIATITDTARKLDIKTLDQAVAMDYDQAMGKYSVVWNGLKQAFNVYGLSIDKTLDSATAKTVRSDARTATVRVDYTLLGKPQHVTVDLVKIDNRWYDKDLLDHWRKINAQEQATPVAAPQTAPAAAAKVPAAKAS